MNEIFDLEESILNKYKENGFADYIDPNWQEKREEKWKFLFINEKEYNETLEKLLGRISHSIDKYYLEVRELPKKILFSNSDYLRLSENTTIIDNNCILGIPVSIIREDYKNKEYKNKRRKLYA